jgi:Protein of unknown function (DUF3309)
MHQRFFAMCTFAFLLIRAFQGFGFHPSSARELFAYSSFPCDSANGEDAPVMTTILIIVLLILLLGGGGGYYGHRRYGGRGLGGVLGLILIILLVLWLIGTLGPVQI